ncbi:hypothetical protein KUCAC02_009718, partial [Chaenocephalus aceratus]
MLNTRIQQRDSVIRGLTEANQILSRENGDLVRKEQSWQDQIRHRDAATVRLNKEKESLFQKLAVTTKKYNVLVVESLAEKADTSLMVLQEEKPCPESIIGTSDNNCGTKELEDERKYLEEFPYLPTTGARRPVLQDQESRQEDTLSVAAAVGTVVKERTYEIKNTSIHLNSLTHCPPVSLTHCPPVSLTHCPPVSLTHCPPVSLTHCPPVSLTHCPPVSLTHCPPVSLTHCPPVSLTHCPPVSLTHCPPVVPHPLPT